MAAALLLALGFALLGGQGASAAGKTWDSGQGPRMSRRFGATRWCREPQPWFPTREITGCG